MGEPLRQAGGAQDLAGPYDALIRQSRISVCNIESRRLVSSSPRDPSGNLVGATPATYRVELVAPGSALVDRENLCEVITNGKHSGIAATPVSGGSM